MSAQERIDELVKSNDVILFMKGNRSQPQCGFSARVVGILDDYLDDYPTVNVLADPAIREGIKEYSSWPTIPQLYVKGEFVGGCDIVTEMSESGELSDVLGAEEAEVTVPEVTLTDAALSALKGFMDGDAAPSVRVQIPANFQYGMDFDSPGPRDVVVEGNGYQLVLDRSSARRADGMTIDFVEAAGGGGFKMTNPNEPAKVQMVAPGQVKEWLDGGKPIEFFDVRTPAERDTAKIEGARLLDDEVAKEIEGMDRQRPLVFHCHHGMRSQRAAEHFLKMGFTEVYNMAGGIDAWSQEVDSSVPRY